MRKMIFFVAVAALALFGFGAYSQQKPEPIQQDKKEVSKATAAMSEGHMMKITLSGGAEAPGPGDTDGSGEANLTFNHEKGEVCYDITVKDVEPVTGAHIHAGAAGKSGGVKVGFKAGADGAWKGCAAADKALIADMMKNPGNYYVNVHTADFPNGALRGQLGK